MVFQVSHGASMVGPDVYLAARPTVTIYGSGDAYVIPRAENSWYAGGPVALARGTVPMAELRTLVRDAANQALFDHADYGTAQVTDAGDSAFTFRPGRAAAHALTVYALDTDEADSTLTSQQAANRQALRTFERRLRSSVVRLKPWLSRRVDVTEVSDSGLVGADRALTWPGPPLDPLLTAHQRGRCGVLSGQVAQRVYLAAVRHATMRWLDHGTGRTLVLRALLPGEAGCGD